MKAVPISILLVDDDPDLRDTMSELLAGEGHSVTVAGDGAEALALARERAFDLVISDVRLPRLDGHSLLDALAAEQPELRVLLVTAFGDISNAVNALQRGAFDYIAKPFDGTEFLTRVARAAEQRRLERELEEARANLAHVSPSALIVGNSAPIRRVLERIALVAQSDAPTLVTGESGTGKELAARMIHDCSARRERPFVAVNCGALAETLIEAELFGHERGAFTGAERRRDGRFKSADGGTLFLDEIAELPLPAQAKLLRVLQEGTFEPLGSNTPIKVDVRVVSATHRDLRERVRAGTFREDLFYRINVIEVALPPLRERPGDLPLLVQHFLQRFAPKGRALPTIGPSVWAALRTHPFPGNVRELSHAIQHAVVLSGGGEIGVQHLPSTITRVTRSEAALDVVEAGGVRVRPLATAIREFEREYLTGVLRETNGRKTHAASLLEISRKTLWEKLRSYGIDSVAASE